MFPGDRNLQPGAQAAETDKPSSILKPKTLLYQEEDRNQVVVIACLAGHLLHESLINTDIPRPTKLEPLEPVLQNVLHMF